MVNGLARERDGMVTVTVRLPARHRRGWTVVDPETGAAVPALAEGVRRHPDGSLAEVTLTFRARGVPRARVPALPAAPRSRPTGPAGCAAAAGRTSTGLAIENDAFAVTADPAGSGALASVARQGRPGGSC